MNKEQIMYGVVGLLAGLLIAGGAAVYAVNGQHTGMMGMHSGHDGTTMEDMVSSLQGKSGDDFDKAFLEEMIMHHQGAVDMAEQAKAHAKHDEIKAMAQDILSVQSKEIDMMQSWQSDWGYKSVPKSHMD